MKRHLSELSSTAPRSPAQCAKVRKLAGNRTPTARTIHDPARLSGNDGVFRHLNDAELAVLVATVASCTTATLVASPISSGSWRSEEGRRCCQDQRDHTFGIHRVLLSKKWQGAEHVVLPPGAQPAIDSKNQQEALRRAANRRGLAEERQIARCVPLKSVLTSGMLF